MKTRGMALLINSGLFTVLAGVLILPLGFIHVLTQSVQTNPRVAGAASAAETFVVLPNFFDFGTHALFNPIQKANVFTDTLTVTAFKSQVATYHTVYTVLNRTDTPVSIEILLENVPEPTDPYALFLLSIAKEKEAHTTTLTDAASIGSIQLQVEDSSVALGTRYVVIDGEPIQIRAVDGNILIIDPTDKEFKKGATVYKAGLLVRDGSVVWSNMTSALVAGNGSATINAVVIGKSDVETSTIAAPLLIQSSKQ